MKLSISQKNELPVLSRTEVHGHVTFDAATPSNAEIRKQLSSSLKAKEDLVVVKRIYAGYGDKTASVLAYVYKDVDALNSIEVVGKKAKERAAEKAPKPAEKPAADKEKKAEKPAAQEEKAGTEAPAKAPSAAAPAKEAAKKTPPAKESAKEASAKTPGKDAKPAESK